MNQIGQSALPHARFKFLASLLRATRLFAVLLCHPFFLHAQNSPATLPDLKLSSSAGAMNALAVQDDGKIIVAGLFNAINDVARIRLGRLNPNGSVDQTWNITVNNFVDCIAISGTNIYLGGNFNLVNGQVRGGLARVSTVDGTLDLNWNPVVFGGAIDAMVLDGTNLYIAGAFTTVGGQPRNHLARLNANGTGLVDAAWNPGADGEVTGLLVSGTNILARGAFANIGGLARAGVAKLGTSGLVDASWNPNPSPAGISAFALDGTNVYLAGGFKTVGGIAQTNLVKLALTGAGAVDASWHPPLALTTSVNALAVTNQSLFIAIDYIGAAKVDAQGTGSVATNWQVTADGRSISQWALTQSGLIGVGGFSRCNGAVSLSIAKLDLVTGARDATFPAQIESAGKIYAIARQPDGKTLVGGDFYFVAGLPRQHLARINADGTFDSFWRPDPDGVVSALDVVGTNIFVGGSFDLIGGLQRTNLARLSTSGSDAADPGWDAGLTDINQFINALAHDGTNLFVAGSFLRIGGQNRSLLARLNAFGTGLADASWSASPNSRPNVLLVVGTNLFVGGSFNGIKSATRTGLAKVSTLGTGDVDAAWNPVIADIGSSLPNVTGMAAVGTNLFFAGGFTNVNGQSRSGLAKVSLFGTGAVDVAWNPFATATAAAASYIVADTTGTNLYISGNYSSNSVYRPLFRASTEGAGAVDVAFNPAIALQTFVLLASGRDLYVGGFYTSGGYGDHQGFAFLPIVDAPQLIQDTATDVYIQRNQNDGPEVTHFRITAVSGGTLYKQDGATQIKAGDFITVAEGGAGLKFNVGGTLTAVSALNNTTNGAGKAAATLTMVASPGPTFTFSSPTCSVREGQGDIVVSVQKYGAGTGTVSYATSDLTAIAGIKYQARSGTFNFSATDKTKNIVILVADNFVAEGDQQFAVNLTNPSAGAAVAAPNPAVVTIVDNDIAGISDSLFTTVLPAAAPVSSGVLSITLQPANAVGQWHLVGELNWHDSGASVTGLVTGNYSVEFRPVVGYQQPQNLTLPVSTGVTNTATFFYAATTNTDAGNLAISIAPDDVAGASDTNSRGQWRRQGEAGWRNSGDLIPQLNAGNYTVEFKPLAGRSTPPVQIVAIGGGNATYGAVGTYYFGAVNPNAPMPAVVPFGTATTSAPYLYNGQLQTGAGFGSGFVVKQRVVLTAAHVLFDDVLLKYTTTTRWFFQRYRNQLEPVPQVPRGWYIFDGYAAERQLDNSPGVSTPASQNLDAAALYFLEDAGRGGYGGYLSTDADNNEYLLSANNKFLAGYPLDGVTNSDQGKLFASAPANLGFTRLYTGIFSTTNVQSFPGNSGGPLYVQTDVNQYLPAGIFLGGSGQTLVRAINSEVVDLINRAETSGNGGGNSTGGGASMLSAGLTTSSFGTGLLTVNLSPVVPGFVPGWRITGDSDTNYITDATSTVSLIGGGSYPVEFKPAAGFITPSNRTVQINVGQTTTIAGNYGTTVPVLKFISRTNLNFTGVTGGVYRVEYATNLAGAPKWTPLITQTLTSSSITITNLVTATNKARFFRTVLLP